jgi:hypothetical protein
LAPLTSTTALQADHWNLNHKGYLPLSGGPVNFNVNDPMLPWSTPITPAIVANFYRIDSKGYKYKKYFRDNIIDRDEEMKALKAGAEAIGRTIVDDTLEVNFDSLKGSIDELTQTLSKPLFPFS